MGKLLSKFRKEKTTIQLLEGLEEKIKKREAFTVSTQARQKRLIGNFLVISIGLYVIAFIVFYFVFFPPTWNERIIYSTPLLVFPFLIFLVKHLVAWYFQRKVNKNSTELQTLRTEKKKILEQVQEKETYKVALEILNKFGEKPQIRPVIDSPRPTQALIQARTPQTAVNPALRQRLGATPSQPQQLFRSPQYVPQLNRSLQPATPLARRTPFPIIDQRDKGVVEKMVDYLIGDGPANRFAMICKQCFGHNGMALQEEYEYTSFKCAFCGTLNQAKKQRPVAPRLEGTPERRLINEVDSSTSEEEKNSGSDSEEEKPVEKAVENVKAAEVEAKLEPDQENKTTEEEKEE